MRGKIKSIVADYAASVIKAVMEERGVSEFEFRKSNCPKYVTARTIAIKRLYADGFTHTEIEEYVGMDRKTIARRLSPGATNRDNAARSARYHAKKQQEARAQ